MQLVNQESVLTASLAVNTTMTSCSLAILFENQVEKDRAAYSFHFLKAKWLPYAPLELSGH